MIRQRKNVVSSSKDIYVPANINFGEFILHRMWQDKDKKCLINGASGESSTYGKIIQQAMNLAASLTRIGLKKGQSVAICSENRMEFFPTVIGVACCGASLTAFNVGYTEEELRHVMEQSKPEFIFCTPTAYKIHEDCFWSMGYVRKIIMFGTPGFEKVLKTYSYTELVTPGKENRTEDVDYEEFDVVDVDGQTDTLFVLFTSGTTGPPKAVKLTHLNVITACCSTSFHYPDASSLVTAPWFYSTGLISILTAMAYGSTVVYLTKFEIEQYMRTIKKYKIEYLEAAPPILMALGNTDIIDIDISSIKVICAIGATLHPNTIRELKDRLPNAKTAVQSYCMTETTSNIIRYDYSTVHLAKSGAIGFFVEGCKAKVVDLDTGNTLGPNQDGELYIKGPLVMKNYVGGDYFIHFDKDHYFKTGDVVYYDKDGTFYFVDRVEEMMNYQDHLVSPSEIEAALLKHDAVFDVGVVGVEDPNQGEVPQAFVVKRPGDHISITEDELRLFVAKKLSEPKHYLGGVHFVDQIPRNQNGKILRKQLKAVVRSEKISKPRKSISVALKERRASILNFIKQV